MWQKTLDVRPESIWSWKIPIDFWPHAVLWKTDLCRCLLTMAAFRLLRGLLKSQVTPGTGDGRISRGASRHCFFFLLCCFNFFLDQKNFKCEGNCSVTTVNMDCGILPHLFSISISASTLLLFLVESRLQMSGHVISTYFRCSS